MTLVPCGKFSLLFGDGVSGSKWIDVCSAVDSCWQHSEAVTTEGVLYTRLGMMVVSLCSTDFELVLLGFIDLFCEMNDCLICELVVTA